MFYVHSGASALSNEFVFQESPALDIPIIFDRFLRKVLFDKVAEGSFIIHLKGEIVTPGIDYGTPYFLQCDFKCGANDHTGVGIVVVPLGVSLSPLKGFGHV